MFPPRPAKSLSQHYAEIASPEILKFTTEGADKAWESRQRAHADLHDKMVAAKGDPSKIDAAIQASKMLAGRGGDHGKPASEFSRLSSMVGTQLNLAKGEPGVRDRNARIETAIKFHQAYRDVESRSQFNPANDRIMTMRNGQQYRIDKAGNARLIGGVTNGIDNRVYTGPGKLAGIDDRTRQAAQRGVDQLAAWIKAHK